MNSWVNGSGAFYNLGKFVGLYQQPKTDNPKSPRVAKIIYNGCAQLMPRRNTHAHYHLRLSTRSVFHRQNQHLVALHAVSDHIRIDDQLPPAR